MKSLTRLLSVCFILFRCGTDAEAQTSVIKDREGNIYSVKVMADNKTWMTENLKISIPGTCCYKDSAQNCVQYGRLYSWSSAKKGCEMLGEGWRLPTNEEWRQMAAHYGGIRDDHGKDSGRTAFKMLLAGGNAGFNARLGGGRDPDSSYARMERHGFYWTATQSNSEAAWFYNFGRGAGMLNRHNDGEKTRAFSVRCINDAGN